MKNNKPIFWHQGLFLQPQHFQLTDLYYQSLLGSLADFVTPYLWGIGRLKIDEDAIKEHSLVIEETELIFPDGAHVEFPGNAVIASRSFEQALFEEGKPLKVYLGLKKWDTSADNVSVLSSFSNVSAVNTRFASSQDPEEISDFYSEGPQAMVKRLSYVPKIFWESEKDQLAQYSLIPICQLVWEGENPRISERFIAPCLHLSSTRQLHSIIMEINERVSSRCRRLEEYKSPRGMQASELEPGVFFLLMGLRTISKYVPLLAHLSEMGSIHPLQAYEILIQMVGELSLFSKNVSATGENESGARLIPSYDHLNLYRCFSALNLLIGQLLDEITFGPESIIRLEPFEQYLVGRMEPNVFSDRNVYYLSLRTDSDFQSVKDSVQTVAKLSARENLPTIIPRALPGIGLEHVPIPPPGLPQISSTVYFKIDIKSSQWDDVQRMNNIALFWDEAPEDLVAEVIVLRRS